MKILNKILPGLFAVVIAAGCNDGIDPISSVEPGADVAPPSLTVTYPIEGTKVRVKQDVAPITIKFDATDDIEIKDVKINLDGADVTTFTEFPDYRHAIKEFTYPTLANGEHVVTVSVSDISGKTSTQTINFVKEEPYKPVYAGENFYMPFDGEYLELVSIATATQAGSPTFSSDAESGQSYKGAKDAYLTLPTTGLLGDEFSAAFWYKINGTPDRSGILTISPPDPAPATPGMPNKRGNGFRFFREGSPTNQTFKLNVGTGGTNESWFDGGAAASVNPATSEWIHLAFTISQSKAVVYVNGEVVSQGDFDGVDWTGCDLLAIGSGAPRFIEWGHLSDNSLYDELRMFNKVLTQDEVKALME